MTTNNVSRIILLGICFKFALSITLSSAQEIDADTGLIIDDGWESVRLNCIACHSAQIIVQNSGTREVWKSRISWMQETQGLGDLTIDVEEKILGYLSENYPQKSISRRAGLPLSLLPPNPLANKR